MRILPHHQDTGGFFIALLEKQAEEKEEVKLQQSAPAAPPPASSSSSTRAAATASAPSSAVSASAHGEGRTSFHDDPFIPMKPQVVQQIMSDAATLTRSLVGRGHCPRQSLTLPADSCPRCFALLCRLSDFYGREQRRQSGRRRVLSRLCCADGCLALAAVRRCSARLCLSVCCLRAARLHRPFQLLRALVVQQEVGSRQTEARGRRRCAAHRRLRCRGAAAAQMLLRRPGHRSPALLQPQREAQGGHTAALLRSASAPRAADCC